MLELTLNQQDAEILPRARLENPEFLHVCLPGELSSFETIIEEWTKIRDVKSVVVHFIIRPGATKKIQERFNVSVLYSPVRGVHRRFLDDVKKYSKFVASEKNDIDPKIRNNFKKKI